jgi:hypothetical protein
VSNRWRCPKCNEGYEKSYFVKTIQAENKSIDFSHLTCKVCNNKISMHKLTNGFYDIPDNLESQRLLGPGDKLKRILGLH